MVLEKNSEHETLVKFVKTFLFLGLLRAGMACSVCYGGSESAVMKGAEAAVWVLLGVTGLILSAFGIFIFQLRKRAIQAAALSSESVA